MMSSPFTHIVMDTIKLITTKLIIIYRVVAMVLILA